MIVIHDAAALRHPEWYSPAYAAWQGRILPALARRALHVVTVSEFSRRELTELLGLQDVSVIPGGVDPRYTPEADATAARRELGLTKPYVLCVASQTARKNLQALTPLAAARRGRRRRRPPPAVRARGRARRPPPPRRRARALLPGLYAGAEAFALPSLYEGFGLPVLEAMACGTPVVASDLTALPDTAGGAARLAPPDEVAAAVRSCWMTRRRGTGCVRRACGARGSSPGRAPPREMDALLSALSSRAAARYTASDRALTTRPSRSRRSPDQLNAFTDPSRDSHVYQ